jgi:ATP-dependent helicase/nuclease subunit B
MTPFLYALRQCCADHAGLSLWLLAPTPQVGRQWLAQVSRHGVATAHVRICTLAEIALELAKQREPRLDEWLLSANGVRVLIEQLWPLVKAHQKEGYFSRLETTSGLTAALTDTILALRRAGVHTSQFQAEDFDNPAKGMELAQLLTAYELRLELSRLADEADVWKHAAAVLIDKAAQFPDEVRLAIPEEMMAATHGLAATVLQLLPMELTTLLDSGETASLWEEETFQADRQLLRWLTEPMSAPPARGDGTLRMFRAVSEADEVREVLRRCAAERISLGDVEILYADTEVYQPILLDMLAALESEAAPAVTLGDGLPLSRTRPGRALKAWIAWIDSDYRQSLFLSFIQEGLLREPIVPTVDLLRELRSLPIGWGRNRYRECITARLQSGDDVAVFDEDGEVVGTEPTETLQELESFWAQLQPLLQLLPTEPRSVDWLQAALHFLERFAACLDEADVAARNLLTATITDLLRWVKLDSTPLRWDIHAWLRNLPSQLRLPGEVPQPGHLHLAHWSQGGHSGRPFTFLLGLDDARFPGGRLPQVLLMPPERQKISPELPTDGRLREEQRQHFLRMLRRLPGRITFGFSCFDILDNRERFPSWVVRGVFRLLSGQEETDQRKLEEFLGPPVGFTPTSPRHCLTAGEWWHYQLLNPPRIDGVGKLLAKRYPHLAQGIAAQQQRHSPTLTPFDGWVPEAGRDHDPCSAQGMILTAGRLELLARCPLSFFFKHLLEAVPPPEAELDPAAWLSALARNELLQEVFFAYYDQLKADGQPPNYEADLPRLLDLLHARVGRYLKRYPCPSSHALQSEISLLEQTVRMFLREQVRQAGQQKPLHLEVSLGHEEANLRTPLDSNTPVRVSLGNGLTLRLRGRVDRVDQVQTEGDTAYSIVNYKLGSPSRYADAGNQQEGRVLQHVVHYEMVQAHLREVQGPAAEVKHLSLFFPGERGQGERLQWTAAQMQEERAKLALLCALFASGVFVPSNKSTDCLYCAYGKVCTVPADTQASQQKLTNAANESLHPFRELRHGKKR